LKINHLQLSEIVNAEQYFLAIDQLEELNKYLLEPIGRNTAIALALEPDELVLATPSDHLIKDELEYAKARKIT